MQPPFTADQFFDVFRRYNEAVWPAQVALNAIGVLAAAAAYRANARRSRTWARVAIVLMAGLWLWTGIVYFKMFFVAITPAAQVFGSFFIAEAALLLICAWEIGPLDPASRTSLAVGGFIIVYSLLVYPIVGMATGQAYPALPTFGAPCPITIFTFGVLCAFPSSVSRVAVAVPVLWVAISSYAALGFSVYEDFGLLAAAIAAIVVMHQETRRSHVAPLAV
ncbi:MAG TPA: DUF6064 family protein [Thermoanaerobaculia bacterium]